MSGADIAVVAIVVLSGLVALSLGLVRVVLALAGWVGAAVATLYGFPYVRPLARDWISVGLLADAAAGLSIFIATLIVLTILSHAVGRRIRGSALSALDRSLGLIFGFGLGAVLVSFGYLGLVWAIDLPPRLADQPPWIREARTRPLVEWGAARLRALAPAGWDGVRTIVPPGRGAAIDSGEVERTFRRLIEPQTKTTTPPPKKGYTDAERREMDRLFRGQR